MLSKLRRKKLPVQEFLASLNTLRFDRLVILMEITPIEKLIDN
jgi:hypothetical protein